VFRSRGLARVDSADVTTDPAQQARLVFADALRSTRCQANCTGAPLDDCTAVGSFGKPCKPVVSISDIALVGYLDPPKSRVESAEA
jgi:hypothetical protein